MTHKAIQPRMPKIPAEEPPVRFVHRNISSPSGEAKPSRGISHGSGVSAVSSRWKLQPQPIRRVPAARSPGKARS